MDDTLTPTPDDYSAPILKPRTMDFPDAMRQVINGKKVARVSWGNKDYCLLRDGWLTIFTKDAFHTWTVNDGDLEGQDWTVVNDIKEVN